MATAGASAAPRSRGQTQPAFAERWLRHPRETLLSIAVFFGLLGIWELVVRISQISPLVFPGPAAVVGNLVQIFRTGFVLPHLQITIFEIVFGFFAGSLLGVTLGVALVQSEVLTRLANPYIIASQAMPKLALAPIFAMWFGFDMAPKILIAALIVFFPLLENTVRGLNEVDEDQLELFRVLRADRWQTFLKLQLPNALPYIFAGLRVAIVLAVVGAVVGEYVGANRGLGALIISSQGTLNTTQMFSAFVLLTVIGVVLYKLVEWADRLVMKWRYGE
jgi:NitT/TauT family transport system permease protein